MAIATASSKAAASGTRLQTTEPSPPNALRGRKGSSATLQSLFSPKNSPSSFLLLVPFSSAPMVPFHSALDYWGGALFCMMADLQIRKETHNKKGLQDALRGILAARGSIAVDWPISKVIAVGDQATGTSVLADLYQKMGKQAFPPIDLDALWKQLGIRVTGGTVQFDNHAPLAAIRQAITQPKANQRG